jgi:hypothetical protein
MDLVGLDTPSQLTDFERKLLCFHLIPGVDCEFPRMPQQSRFHRDSTGGWPSSESCVEVSEVLIEETSFCAQ